MRYITKKPEPVKFSIWRKKRTPAEQQAWGSLKSEDGALVKSEVKAALLVEQGYVCCYCEQRIEETSSHIEHLASRDDFPKRVFDYSNLLACCQKPVQCGSLKGRKEIKVHPLLPDCREHFRFTSDGRILATTPVAKEAISILGLGISSLNAQRRCALIGFTDALKGMEPVQARQALARIDEVDSQGKNTPFASAILCVFKPQSTGAPTTQGTPKK